MHIIDPVEFRQIEAMSSSGYRQVVEQMWSDGRIIEVEFSSLTQLQKELGISEDAEQAPPRLAGYHRSAPNKRIPLGMRFVRSLERRQAAGDAFGQFLVANRHQTGIGLAKEEPEAVKWLRKAKRRN